MSTYWAVLGRALYREADVTSAKILTWRCAKASKFGVGEVKFQETIKAPAIFCLNQIVRQIVSSVNGKICLVLEFQGHHCIVTVFDFTSSNVVVFPQRSLPRCEATENVG